MSSNTTHITTSGGLMSAAFIESIHTASIQRAGVERESFSLPWREAPKGAAAPDGDGLGVVAGAVGCRAG